MALARILQFFGSLLSTAVIGFGLSSNFWINFVFKEKKFHSGLWNICERDGRCRIYDKFLPGEDDPQWLKQVRLFLIIGCITSAISIMISVLRLYNANIKGYIPALFMFVTAALGAGACWLFSERKDYHNEHYFEHASYDWGFMVACSSAIFSLLLMTFDLFSDVISCRKAEEVGYGFVSYV